MAIRYQLPRETAVDKILNAANVFLDRELDRKQRREETRANQEFRKLQLKSLNDYRDDQELFRDKQFKANQDFQKQQLQRSDEREYFSAIGGTETLQEADNIIKAVGEISLSESGERMFKTIKAGHQADIANPLRNMSSFRNIPGLDDYVQASNILNKRKITNKDIQGVYQGFLKEAAQFKEIEARDVAGFMTMVNLSRKNLETSENTLKDLNARLIVTKDPAEKAKIQNQISQAGIIRSKQLDKVNFYSDKVFNALENSGTIQGFNRTDDDTESTDVNFLPYRGFLGSGSILPTYEQVRNDATYIGSFTLPDGGQGVIDASGEITINPADFDPNKNFEQEEVDITGATPEIATEFGTAPTFEGMASGGLQMQEVPDLTVTPTEGDPVNAISRLAGAEMADGGIADIFGRLGDTMRLSSSVQRSLGTGRGGVLSMGGATRDQIKAVRNAELNLGKIENDLSQMNEPFTRALGGMRLTENIYESEDEYLSLNNSKNKEFQSLLINVSQAIQQPNLTNVVKNRLTKTLDKYILKVDKAATRAEKSGFAQRPIYNKETIALVNAIKTGQVLPEESVAVEESVAAEQEGGLESTLKRAFENMNPSDKRIYNNDFEVYLKAYINNVKNMVGYGKIDEAQGAEMLEGLE